MRKLILIVTAVLAVSISILVACTDSQKDKTAAETSSPAPISHDSLVKKGDYLVSTMGCDDCHTPKLMSKNGPEIDFSRRLSGHPSSEPIGKIDQSVMKEGWMLFGMGLTSYVGPWGLSYSANLTSDSTGIGMWTEEQFFRAIRTGVSKGIEGNRPLLPPMPWFVYKNLKDEDLKAIFAYLKSTKPVKNVVPQPKAGTEL